MSKKRKPIQIPTSMPDGLLWHQAVNYYAGFIHGGIAARDGKFNLAEAEREYREAFKKQP